MSTVDGGEESRVAVPPPRLLVVEDDRSIAELLSMWFRSSGWHVAVAHSGPEGVARAVAFRPDAVVLDGMLPGYGGLEVMRRLRVTSPALPIVLSTAMDSDQHRREALSAGADAYLVKPWSLLTLHDTVESLTRRRR
ncbi:response regulator [Nocardioides sp.]|uniref:response regulator transcription factor n=1 Tax=Nocardioides sp. TaxID=35761 RepID=UPI001A200F23|nr:response regulator [Nocardioides sp.]MBJ7359527.1 response regulator [Nocardioides sp.]